jgi:hypothetical protein
MWITGHVIDDHGRPLSAVRVEISGAGAGRRRAVVSNTRGEYVLQDLRPGEHTITFARAGFSTLERKTGALTTYVATVNARLHQVKALGM